MNGQLFTVSTWLFTLTACFVFAGCHRGGGDSNPGAAAATCPVTINPGAHGLSLESERITDPFSLRGKVQIENGGASSLRVFSTPAVAEGASLSITLRENCSSDG